MAHQIFTDSKYTQLGPDIEITVTKYSNQGFNQLGYFQTET